MKTTCYCAYCTKHHLYGKLKDSQIPLGYGVDKFVSGVAGKEVDCLEPIAEILDYELMADEFSFPATAYGDGMAITVFEAYGQSLWANCGNEDYQGEKQWSK